MTRVELRSQQLDLRTDWSQRLAAIGTMLTVLAAFVTIFFTTQASRDQAALAERGQVTDRFSRAVDQLGDDKLQIRLGGIYALERIGKDSPPDRLTIDEVLTAFIRETPAVRSRDEPQSCPQGGCSPTFQVRTDVQAALTVLVRAPGREERALDLRKAQLPGASLPMAALRGAYLNGANLEGAELAGANLKDAHLFGADHLSYDWREHEAWLQGLPWVLAGSSSAPVRAVHVRAPAAGAAAVLLLHGWPDSVPRFKKVLPLLTDLHVVVPALQGFPFAAPVAHGGMSS